MAQHVDPRSYLPGPMVGGMPVRGDTRITPRLPLHATPMSAGPYQEGFQSNGTARAPSGRKRRAVGTGPGQRPQSMNYTQTQVLNGHSPSGNDPNSFASRTQGYAGSDDFVSSQDAVDLEAAVQPVRERRRRSSHQASHLNAYAESPREPPPSVPAVSAASMPASAPAPLENSAQVSAYEPAPAPVPIIARQAPVEPPSHSARRRRQQIYAARDDPSLDEAVPNLDVHHVDPERESKRYEKEIAKQSDLLQESKAQQYSQRQPIRSDTRHASAGPPEPWEWATDKSPLQKLEGRLNTISRTKEEKRARAERAEQRLRERRRSEQAGDATVDRSNSKRTPGGRYSVPKDTRPPAQVYLDTYANIDEDNPSYSSAAPPSKTREAIRGDVEPVVVSSSNKLDQRSTEKPNNVANTDTVSKGTLGLGGESSRELPGQGQRDALDRNMPENDMQPVSRSRGERNPSPRKTHHDQQQQQQLRSPKMQSVRAAATLPNDGESINPPLKRDAGHHDPDFGHQIPPQKAAAIEARRQVGFDDDPLDAGEAQSSRKQERFAEPRASSHNRISSIEPNGPHQILDEWRRAGVARLTAPDLNPSVDARKEHKAWWEKESSRGTRGLTGQSDGGATAFDGSYESILTESATFNPPLYLKCGPLLRYTGLKRDKLELPGTGNAGSHRETWRGSIMIVTLDAKSQYQPAPILRLFAEPMKLLSPPLQRADKASEESIPPEYLDPVAGLPKLSMTGRTVYVKPVEDLQPEMDLSRLEGDEGLFEQFRTAVVPTSYGKPDPRTSGDPLLRRSDALPAQAKSRRRGQEVRGIRLHAERGVTFWRFNLEIELGEEQARVAYRINNSPSIGFWVPARGQVMNIMYYSCNGFSLSVNPATFSGPDPLWRDVLNNHQTRPFHVMIGGGDQIYNDVVMEESPMLRAWLELKTDHDRRGTAFLPDLQEELERFYLGRYCMWFSQGLFGMANSQIPMINVWNDRDIIDGFGSYPDQFMNTPVFCGLGAVAYKYYMLFQHQSVPAETSADEPSWLLGAAPGPYINEPSRSVFMSLGKHVAFLALDCRTERMQEEVLSGASYDLIFDRCRKEILQGDTKHLIVSLGVPIAYPRLVWLENILTSRALDPIKTLSRKGVIGGFLNKFDGGVEILDDLDNQWTAHNHKAERNWIIQELQELAAEKSVRITILGGNAQLAAVGQFYSNPKLGIRKDRDHRYMPNVISSAIVNAPPPEMMADVLNKRNKVHHLDLETDEDMIPMFTHDVDGRVRNNKRLLTRRNWCSIREYQPGSTPPPSRSPSPSEDSMGPEGSRRPGGRLQRTLSLTREDVKPSNLIRRLSQRGPPPTSMKYPVPNNAYPPSPPDSDSNLPSDGHTSFQARKRLSSDSHATNGVQRHSSAPLTRPGNFRRRPTNLSIRAAKKGGAEDDEDDHINLEHGLDIVLNCEISQKDPAGITVPYRLLVPALWYEGDRDIFEAPLRRKSLLSRFGSLKMAGRRKSSLARNQSQGNWGRSESFSDRSYTPSPERQVQPFQPRPQNLQQNTIPARHQNFKAQEIQENSNQPKQQNLKAQSIQSNADPPVVPEYKKCVQNSPPPVDSPPVIPPSRQPVQNSPPPVGIRMMEMRGQDRLDQYHDNSPVRDSSYPARRPSKLDRVLGIGSHRQAKKYGDDDHVDEVEGGPHDYSDNDDHQEDFHPAPPVRRPSKLERVLSFGRRRKPQQYADYDSADDMSRSYNSYSDSGGEQEYDHDGRPISMGYSGIEAYKEKEKGWKRWFS